MKSKLLLSSNRRSELLLHNYQQNRHPQFSRQYCILQENLINVLQSWQYKMLDPRTFYGYTRRRKWYWWCQDMLACLTNRTTNHRLRSKGVQTLCWNTFHQCISRDKFFVQTDYQSIVATPKMEEHKTICIQKILFGKLF